MRNYHKCSRNSCALVFRLLLMSADVGLWLQLMTEFSFFFWILFLWKQVVSFFSPAHISKCACRRLFFLFQCELYTRPCRRLFSLFKIFECTKCEARRNWGCVSAKSIIVVVCERIFYMWKNQSWWWWWEKSAFFG